MADLTHEEFARRRRVDPRQVRKWLRLGLPTTRQGLIPARAGAAWVRRRAKDRARAADETRALLLERAGELQAELAALVAAHVPSSWVAATWASIARRASETLRPWPARVAPLLAARARGDATAAPITDPRITEDSAAMLATAPGSATAMVLATDEQARIVLEALQATTPEADPARQRALAAAGLRWTARPPMTAPRSLVAAWRARLVAFRREIKAGRWEQRQAVADRFADVAVITRQRLLERAPGEVAKLPKAATPAQLLGALERAVEAALFELRRGVRSA